MAERTRLSINLITLGERALEESLAACADHSIGYAGMWRHHFDATARSMLDDRGLRVSSLCRGGFFPAPSAAERAKRIDENRHAIDEAAALEAGVLVLVCGPPEGQSLHEARAQIREGIAAIVPYARQAGVRLGIEPLHPMLCAARSAITTLEEANDIVEELRDDALGVIVDAYHVWWDPHLETQIARARGSIFGFHVSDWITPNGDALAVRAMMGDGCIDLTRMRDLVDRAGYDGPIEVEVINPSIAAKPLPELLALIETRFVAI